MLLGYFKLLCVNSILALITRQELLFEFIKQATKIADAERENENL
jgi:hypothetical protein